MNVISSGNAAEPCKVYVAGHRGMVGSALVRQLEMSAGHCIITRSRRELDLTRQQDSLTDYTCNHPMHDTFNTKFVY